MKPNDQAKLYRELMGNEKALRQEKLAAERFGCCGGGKPRHLPLCPHAKRR